MCLLRSFFTLLAMFIGGLAGNWAGGELRRWLTGEPGKPLRLVQINPSGETVIGTNLHLTHFVPALFLGLVSKRHGTGAFLGGLFASLMLGEQYEQDFLRLAGLSSGDNIS